MRHAGRGNATDLAGDVITDRHRLPRDWVNEAEQIAGAGFQLCGKARFKLCERGLRAFISEGGCRIED